MEKLPARRSLTSVNRLEAAQRATDAALSRAAAAEAAARTAETERGNAEQIREQQDTEYAIAQVEDMKKEEAAAVARGRTEQQEAEEDRYPGHLHRVHAVVEDPSTRFSACAFQLHVPLQFAIPDPWPHVQRQVSGEQRQKQAAEHQ